LNKVNTRVQTRFFWTWIRRNSFSSLNEDCQRDFGLDSWRQTSI